MRLHPSLDGGPFPEGGLQGVGKSWRFPPTSTEAGCGAPMSPWTPPDSTRWS